MTRLTGTTRPRARTGGARLRRSTVTVAVAALMASAGVAVTVTTSAAAATCASVRFIGVRGSGNPYYPNDPVASMGPTVADLYQKLAAATGAGVIEPKAAVYPAVSISTGFSRLPTETGSYFWSEMLGENAIGTLVKDSIANCPGQRIVLAGHSQGAHTIDGYLATADSTALSRIVGATLFGDPTFNHLSGWAAGTYGPFNGLFYAPSVASFALGGNPIPVPAPAVRGRLRSYCRANDPICQGSVQFAGQSKQATLNYFINFEKAIGGEHSKYVTGQTAQATTYLAGRIAATTPNQAPTAAFTVTRLAGANNPVKLDATGSRDPDGSIVAWQWLEGSRQLSTLATDTVQLGAGTSKTVTLRVTDNRGAVGALTKTVALPNRTPWVSAVSPGGVVGSTRPVLSATAGDPDGGALTYTYRVTGPSVDLTSPAVTGSWQVPASKLDPGTAYAYTVTVRDPGGLTASRSGTFTVAMLPTASDVVPTSTGKGYWQVASDGGVFSYGDAPFHGALPGRVSVTNIIGMARTPTDGGYWLVGRDGGVFAFGDALFAGSLPGLKISVSNIVGMAATKTGRGYWLVGSDGGVFAFGDAGFFGSMGGKPLNAPVTAIAATPGNAGYWLAARDGGIFAFGDAPFYGSMGGKPLNAPVVDMDATPDGKGYWMTAEDGGVFAFGAAQFYGSMAGRPLNGHMTGMATTVTGRGYWLNACDGGIFAFGDAVFRGSNPTYQCRGV